MKPIFVLFGILFSIANCFSQQNKFECACSKIGLDTSWAVSNNISCYLIPVTRDISNIENGNFYLAALVAPSLKESDEMPLLYLHGGPGIATLENVPRYLKSKTWEEIRKNRPLVFFDYRGTGYSEPALCPNIKSLLAAHVAKNQSADSNSSYKLDLWKECRADLATKKIDLSTFNSFQISEDAEAIRLALNINKWSVYGVSFGTTVALNLIRNHDNNINSVILDSPFPPNAPWNDFVRPFDACFTALEKNISSDSNAILHFPNIRNDFVNAVSRLNKNPAKLRINETTEFDCTGDDFAWGIWSAMLKPNAIPLVPLVIREVSKGNDALLLQCAAAFRNPNSFGTFSEYQSKAILCYEGKPKSAEDTKLALLRKYPDFSSFNIDFESDFCDAWQPKSAENHVFAPVVSDVPVLILSGEYDPVCPPLFGDITAKSLSNAVFLEVPSASHAAIHLDDCIRNISINFLLHPKRKFSTECLGDIPKINFVTGNLSEALSDLTRN